MTDAESCFAYGAREMASGECNCRQLRPWREGDPFPPYSVIEERDCGVGSACPLDADGWSGLVIVAHVIAVCQTCHPTVPLTHSHQGTMDPAAIRVTDYRTRADILANVRRCCSDCGDSVHDEERGDTICRLTGMVVAERALDLTGYLPAEVSKQLRMRGLDGGQRPHLNWMIVDQILRMQLSEAWRPQAAPAAEVAEAVTSPQYYGDDDCLRGSRRPERYAPAGDVTLLPSTVDPTRRRSGFGRAARHRPNFAQDRSMPYMPPSPPPPVKSPTTTSSPSSGSPTTAAGRLRLKGYSTRHLVGDALTNALDRFIGQLLYGPSANAPLPTVTKRIPGEWSRLMQSVRQYAEQPSMPLVELLASHIYRTSTATRRGAEHDKRRIEWYSQVVVAVGRAVSFYNGGNIGIGAAACDAARGGSWAATPKELQKICLGVLFAMRDGGLCCVGPREKKIFTLANDEYLAEVLPSEQDVCADKQLGITRQSISSGRKLVNAAIRGLVQYTNLPRTGSNAATAVPRARDLLHELSSHASRWYDAATLQGRAHQLALMESLRVCE